MLDSRSEPCGDAVVSTGAGAITSDYRGPAAADYAVAGVGRTIRRPAAGRHGAGLRGFGAPGRGFARADHPDHESARKGQPHVGQTFDRAGLVRLLTNVLYCGEVRHKGKVYPGEQAAIINRQIWQQAQVLLRQTKGWERVPKRPGALLQDLLRSGVCGSRMVAGYSTKKQRQYGYYVCRKAQQQGAASCPGQSIPAARMEGAILAGLGELAAAGARQPLRGALHALERGARRRRLGSFLERIDYDGCRGEVSVCWRASGMDGAPVSIPVRNRAAMRSSPPAPEQSPVTTAARLPRITRLLALAVRFEGLLQEGTVRDYADLARLGGVSRARITQIMSLRGRVSRTWGRRSIVRGWCGC